jgi:hypothetical protein
MCEQADNDFRCVRNLTRLDLEANLFDPDDSHDTDLAIRQLSLRMFGVEYDLPRLRSLRLKGLLLLDDDSDEAWPQLPGLEVSRCTAHTLEEYSRSGRMHRIFFQFCTKASSLQQLSMSGIVIQPRCAASDRESGSLARLLVCLRLSLSLL